MRLAQPTQGQTRSVQEDTALARNWAGEWVTKVEGFLDYRFLIRASFIECWHWLLIGMCKENLVVIPTHVSFGLVAMYTPMCTPPKHSDPYGDPYHDTPIHTLMHAAYPMQNPLFARPCTHTFLDMWKSLNFVICFECFSGRCKAG